MAAMEHIPESTVLPAPADPAPADPTPADPTPADPGLRIEPRQPRAVAKIAQILDATQALLVAEAEITISAIARVAEVPPATVYRYFPDRESVLAALAEQYIEAVDQRLQSRIVALAALSDGQWGRLGREVYLAYRAIPGFSRLLRLLAANSALLAQLQRSNQRLAELLTHALGPRLSLPERHTFLIAWMITEAASAQLNLALDAAPEDAEIMVSEMQRMLDMLYAGYMQQAAL